MKNITATIVCAIMICGSVSTAFAWDYVKDTSNQINKTYKQAIQREWKR